MTQSKKDEEGAKAKAALDEAIAKIKKQYGEGATMTLDESPHVKVDVIPTGSLALDIALGVGGVPRGRITEIVGEESTGKSSLCQHIVANAQKMGGRCAYIDMEHALDPAYAAKCGVDVNKLHLSQPDTGEEALGIAEIWIRSGQVMVVIVDSVAALVPKAEIDGEMGDSHMGLQARLMSQAMRKLSGAISQSNTAVVFTNQYRMKIGAVSYGDPRVPSGGNALKYYASIRLKINSATKIKDGDSITGSRIKLTVAKNKVAPPFRVAEFDIMFNEGISRAGDIVDLGVFYEIIDKKGAFLSYATQRIGQGRENAKTFLNEHPALMDEIEAAIRAKAAATDTGLPGTSDGTEDEE